jgi:hypothetical protein
LLDSCVRFGQVARDAGGKLVLENIGVENESVQVEVADVVRLESIRDKTPVPRAVRVKCQLDTISANRPEVTLLVNREKILGHLEEHDPTVLQELFGKEVVVSGIARFRPSGKLLLIEIEYLAKAESSDGIFSSIPRGRTAAPLQMLVTQPGRGSASFFGSWPGEETDEELLASLKALG